VEVMRIKTSKEVLKQALDYVNEIFKGNIRMEINEDRGNFLRVRLKVKDSRQAGARRGRRGQRLINACWHVHGYFIDKIFELDPGAIVYSLGKRYTADNWEWEDRNIGSILYPLYFSEACNCD
jgi:hypothetical protein